MKRSPEPEDNAPGGEQDSSHIGARDGSSRGPHEEPGCGCSDNLF